MTARRAAHPPADPAAFTDDLLSWLGLPPDAGPDDIEAARERLTEFLRSAPPELEAWARREETAASAALACLTGRPGPTDDTDPAVTLGVVDEETGDPLPAGHTPRPTGRPAARPAGRPTGTTRGRQPVRRPRLAFLALLLLVPALVLGVYFLGDKPSSSAHPGGTPSAAPSGAPATPSIRPVDPAKVAALEAKVAKDPKDVTSLRALTDLYFESAEYGKAVPWQAKVVQLRPKDVDQRLVLGAARFNSGDAAGAQREWEAVLRLDDANVEAYYNLGFSHLSADPPNMAKAKAAWAKVVALAPESELARTVKAHLGRFESMPTGTAAPGAK